MPIVVNMDGSGSSSNTSSAEPIGEMSHGSGQEAALPRGAGLGPVPDASRDLISRQGRGTSQKPKKNLPTPATPDLQVPVPQPATTGRHRSLIPAFMAAHPDQKSINKNELKLLDNLFRSVRDEKDW